MINGIIKAILNSVKARKNLRSKKYTLEGSFLFTYILFFAPNSGKKQFRPHLEV